MGSDARAFLAERFLGDLNDDFLAFLQQIADGRSRLLSPAGSLCARIRPGGSGRDRSRLGARLVQRRMIPTLAIRPSIQFDLPPRILRRIRRGMRCM